MHRCVLILKVHSNSYEEKNSDKRHLIITRTGGSEHHDLPVPPSHPTAGHQGRGLPRPPEPGRAPWSRLSWLGTGQQFTVNICDKKNHGIFCGILSQVADTPDFGELLIPGRGRPTICIDDHIHHK